MAHVGFLRFRPLGWKYEWSSNGLFASQLTQGFSKHFVSSSDFFTDSMTIPTTLHHTEPNVPSFSFLTPVSASYDQLNRKTSQLRVRIVPWCVLENLTAVRFLCWLCSSSDPLQVPFRFQLGAASANAAPFANAHKGAMRAGAHEQVVHIPPQELLFLSLQLTHEEFPSWSEPVKVVSKGNISGQIVLKDDEGASLRLEVSTELDEHRRRRIIIYNAYWILNRTGLPLTYFTKPSFTSFAAGQGSFCIIFRRSLFHCLHRQVARTARKYEAHFICSRWSRHCFRRPDRKRARGIRISIAFYVFLDKSSLSHWTF